MFEAELVPCPNCHWINEDLVLGYRRSRYRRLGMFALGVGFFGTIGSLIGAWFVSIGPVADRAALPYFLLGGPTIFVSLALAMILFRKWRRRLIQPNRDFPLPPQIPDGTPPAMIDVNGELVPAKQGDDDLSAASEWYEFQIGRDQLPLVCCQCLENAATEHAYKQSVTETLELDIPRCANCARQSKRDSRRVWWFTVAIALVFGGGVLLAIPLDPIIFWILFGTYSLICLAIGSYVATVMTAPVKVGRGNISRGIVRLRFSNPEYRRVLSQSNSPKY